MTDIVPATSTAMEPVDGLEDIGSADLVLPILKLAHKDPEWGFENSLTNEISKELNVIVLGVVKQRILWPPDPGAEGEGPICRSYDFAHGIPDPEKWLAIVEKPRTGHPSGFARDLIEAGGPLECGSCPLKEWDTHPKGAKPWCDEQWTVPLMLIGDDGSLSPTLISFSRTAIKPIKNYVTAFATQNKPMYVAITKLVATQQFKGTNPYTVPKFVKVGDSDPGAWPYFSSQLNGIRQFITTPRQRREDAAVSPAAAPAPAPAPVSTPTAAAPTVIVPPATPQPAAEASVAVTEVMETPPTQRAQPVAAAPAPEAPANVPDAEPDEVPF